MKRMPYFFASSPPRSSPVTMPMRSGATPMCRRMSGSTPWPMLPKPMKRMRPGNSTWILFGSVMMLACKARRARSTRTACSVSVAPVRRVGALVAGKRLHARHPAAERGIVDFHRHEARRQRRSPWSLERALHQLDAGEYHQVDGRAGIADDPGGFRQATLDGARFARHCVHRRSNLVAAEIGIAGEHRARDAYHVRLDVGLVFADDPHDRARLLRRAPKERRVRILEIEVIKNGERFEADIVAIPQHRHPSARVECKHLRRLVLLLGELQQVAHVRQPLELERKQHPPRVWTPAAPPELDCHDLVRERRCGDCNGKHTRSKMQHMTYRE